MARSTSRTALVALGAGLVLVGAGCASEEQRLADHRSQAARFHEEGDHRQELIELRSALKLRPKDAQLNYEIGQAYAELGRPAEAAFFHGEAYRLDKSLTDAGLSHAQALAASEPEQAQALIDEIIEREPGNARAYVRRAELELIRSDTEAALTAALTARELDPDDVLTQRTVGTVHRAIIRERKLREEPVPDSMHQAAYDAFETAKRLAEDLERAGPWFDRKEQALIYMEWDGHEAESREAFREAFAMAQEAGDDAGLRQVSRLARTHAPRLGDPEFTKWSLETRVQLRPQDLTAWQRLAARAEAEGREAEEVWKQAIEESPDSPELHRAYARTLFEKGDVAGAFAHLENLPPKLADSAEIGDARVMLHLLQGDTAAARSVVEEMRRNQPDAYQTGVAASRVNLQEGAIDDAAEELRRLSGQYEQGEVFRLLAVAEARLGRSNAAVAAADRAIELEPNASVVPYKIRMSALEAKDDWAGVLRTWRTLRRVGFRVDEQQQSSRITALYGLGRSDIARQILENLLAQDETRTPGIVMLFARHEGHNEPERAMELLEGALEKDPDNWQLVRILAVRELRMRQPERALARIESFEATGAGSLPGLKAQVYTALGRLPEAEAAARENFDRTPRGPNAVNLLVGILQEQDKVDEAIALLEEELGGSQRGLALHFELGKLYRLKGDYDRAVQHLERAHQLQPDWVPPMNDLAYTLADTNRDLDRAIELARTAKARAPESDAVADTLGYAYYKKGLYEPATFELRAAIELANARGYQSADYQYHLGLALQAMGQDDEARRAFDEALRIDPGHDEASRARQSLASAPAERPGA